MSDESALWQRLRALTFYATHLHPCSYLPGEEAVTLFVDPTATLDTSTYSTLARAGFRRSGEHVYRPHCPQCNACIPVRIPVAEFTPDRSQRRTWRRNQDLRVVARGVDYDEAHYQLYRRYQAQRHPGGGMDQGDVSDYLQFITSPWGESVLYEFRERRRLLAVAVVDRLQDGLSAVYTFFDPDESARALGVQAILWQVEEARRQGLDWVYLGFWIQACAKMAYKTRYQPLEGFDGRHWTHVQD